MIRAIIFDWGRTLYDSERGALFPGVPDLLTALAQRYDLAIVSLVSGEYERRVAERRETLRATGIAPLFAAVRFVPADKDGAYLATLAELGVQPAEVAIVDDRAGRGIAWGNRHGATTVWLRRGCFVDELPDAMTGWPTHTIGEIAEVATVLAG